MHPRTRAALDRSGLSLDPNALRVIEPIGYLEMLDLEAGAALVLTDSGGVQKEAFFQGVPCVTLREETEWTETIDLGWNVLATGAHAIDAAAAQQIAASRPAPPPPIYGDGRAGQHIARLLRERCA
jgi:UDP-GlcNAc3NAcA epimerase